MDGSVSIEADYPATRSRKLRLLIPLTIASTVLVEQLDTTIVTTAIPDIARSLRVTPLQAWFKIRRFWLTQTL